MSRTHKPNRNRAHGAQRGDSDLIVHTRQALRRAHPLDILMQTSGLLEVSSVRPLDALRGDSPALTTEQLVDSFIEIDRMETTALLQTFAVIGPETLRDGIESELGRRTHKLPGWLRRLDEVRIMRVVEVTHILNDGEDILIGVEWPTGHRATVAVYIDHNLGTLVKDAFVIDKSVASAERTFRDQAEDEMHFDEIDPADARARIEQAIEHAERTMPPFESDSWPACRSIVEWIVRQLPEGGTGREWIEWSDVDREDLTARFFASPYGEALGDTDMHRMLTEGLLFYGCGYGTADPLHWSPTVVEIVMADWYPRKIAAPASELEHLPEVLRSFIRFAHDERNIPRALTEQTLDAVEHWRPEYLARISDPDRPMGIQAMMDAAFGSHLDEDWDHEEYMLDSLARHVGGRDVLQTLDDAPHQPEEFDWNEVPDDIRSIVEEILELAEGYTTDVLDDEYRTIVRRLLRQVVEQSPEFFRGSGRVSTAAAGLIWVVGKANDLFEYSTVKAMAEWFDVPPSSPAQRGKTLRRAAGVRNEFDFHPWLGDPDLLHSSKRRRLMIARDRYLDQIAER